MIFLLGASVLSCGFSSTQGTALSPVLRDGSHRYFVVQHEGDRRDFASIIAEVLVERGLQATAGETMPAGTDYYVTYADRWGWDMRMFLADLRIDVFEAGTDRREGYGQATQTSFGATGRTFREIIEAAVGELFEGKHYSDRRSGG